MPERLNVHEPSVIRSGLNRRSAMHEIVDLRSDTVTRPTPAMRRAMAEAVVGDDMMGDDPTVQRLEMRAAQVTGKEAALLVVSGTMANLVAVTTHTRPGDEILLDWDAHTLCYEVGGPSVVAGVQTRQFRSTHGVPDLDDVDAAIRTETIHTPGTSLLVLENTHNRAGGTIVPLDVHRRIHAIAQEREVPIHMDGARIFNASVASGVPVADYAACTDSICFCLSKGLGCPVGSVLCGPKDFIDRARRVRKMLGGAMRQSGVLAACGLVALETMVDRLAEDHVNARALAEGIAGSTGLTIDLTRVQTNMVYADTARPAEEWVAALESKGVRCMSTGPRTLRFVTHHDVDAEDIARAVAAIRTAA
jgi:threonine aldolase